MAKRHGTVREGVVAGVLGASGIALWFFIIDGLSGRWLYTPATLGGSLSTLFGPVMGESMLAHVAFYTVLHYAAFIVLGIIVVSMVHAAERTPALVWGLLILFVIFEVGWYGWTALLALPQNLGDYAWLQVMVANLIAAALMGAYLLRGHPTLRGSFSTALEGAD